MDTKHEFANWRELLGWLIKNPQEKKRLAQEADVKPITLKRWVDGESLPREENLLHLAHVLPADFSSTFLYLAEKDFPFLTRERVEHGQIAQELPSDLYALALQIYAKTPPSLARQNLQKLILENAIEHLDPSRQGMAIHLMCCVPPREGQKIRALRQISGIGTPPWERSEDRKTLFVGAESVAGNAVINYRVLWIDSREDTSFTPVNWGENEQSAMAAPILRQARIAGALLSASARPHYFKEAHKNLLELYAHLVTLLFSPTEFYDHADIQLGVMPDVENQAPYFRDIEQRVTRRVTEAQANHVEISNQQARIQVWQDIVDELLQLPGKQE